MNKLMSFALAVLINGAATTAAGASVTGSQTLHYRGEAVSLDDNNKILYREEHQLQLTNQQPVSRRVEYFNVDGELIAAKDNQYHQDPARPDFVLQDLRHNYREQATQQEKGLRLLLQEDNNQQSTLIREADYPLVIDAGFDDFVRQNWQQLIERKKVPFSFVSAARQDVINFTIEATNASKTDQPLKLRMTLKSKLLSWLMDPIKLSYDRNTQCLLSYRGLSNIQSEQGAGQEVLIRYQYPQDSACVNTSSSE